MQLLDDYISGENLTLVDIITYMSTGEVQWRSTRVGVDKVAGAEDWCNLKPTSTIKRGVVNSEGGLGCWRVVVPVEQAPYVTNSCACLVPPLFHGRFFYFFHHDSSSIMPQDQDQEWKFDNVNYKYHAESYETGHFVYGDSPTRYCNGVAKLDPSLYLCGRNLHLTSPLSS